MRVRLFWLFVSAVSAISCRASVNAEANLSGSESANADQGEEDFDKSAADTEAFAEEPDFSIPPTLASARHDLALAGQANTIQCRCLIAAIGDAKSAAFRWMGPAPNIDPETQLVVAFTSSGVECAGEPADSLGASYWGHRITGNDVVVFVEGAREGRPRTEGAVIPKPVGSGQVYLEPVNKKVPYGSARDGSSGRCKLGNVPPERNVAFSSVETGVATESQSATTDQFLSD